MPKLLHLLAVQNGIGKFESDQFLKKIDNFLYIVAFEDVDTV